MEKLRQTERRMPNIKLFLFLASFLVGSSASINEVTTTQQAPHELILCSPSTYSDEALSSLSLRPAKDYNDQLMWSDHESDLHECLSQNELSEELNVHRSHGRGSLLHASNSKAQWIQQKLTNRQGYSQKIDSRFQVASRSLFQADFGEADALLEFKGGIKNYADGALDGWTSSSRSDYCSWTRVTCNVEQSHVTSLNFSSLRMNGSLGPSLWKLSYLEEVHLNQNFLTSEIPPDLGRLSQLRILNLEGNLLFGNIPRELGNLTSLQELNLGSEGYWFNGTIPEELGLLSELEILNLGTVNNMNYDHFGNDNYHNYPPNHLGGKIPSSLANCTKLRYLDFYGNNLLTGGIPEEFGRLSNLNYLSFEQNNLTETVPHELGNLTNLQFLHIGNNAIGGKLPVELANLTSLQILNVGTNFLTGNFLEVKSTSWLELFQLYADGNLFTGEFPECVFSSSQLQVLYLNNNNFTGQLPEKLGRMSNLLSVVIRNNLFEGELPEAFTQMRLVRRFDISNNKLNGSLQPLRNFTAVTNLNLGSSSSSKNTTWENLRGRPSDLVTNSFTGPLTDELVSQWPNLVYLYLDTNSLSGPLPRALGNLTNLQHVLLQGNNFTGGIPEELGQLQNLQLLWLQDNNLTGSIPASLANLQMVTEINLGDNNLTGSIPQEFGNLTQIQYLRLQSNNLTGEIPAELGQLQHLLYLILYTNSLTGSIPETLSNCSTLENVRLSTNSLSGELTQIDFTRLESLTSFSVNENNLNGGFPTAIWSCGNLQLLDLSRNQLSGVLPSFDILNTQVVTQELNTSSLRVLSLASNNFNGFIPPWIWKMPKLQVLDLSSNAFTGSLPDDLSELVTYRQLPNGSHTTAEISQGKLFEQISIRKGDELFVFTYVLETLTSFDLSFNQLGGKLPSELGTLQGLLYLSLANNRFESSIPDNLGNITNLQTLDLSGNQLSGPIPVSLSIPMLGYLNLSLNHLCGPIPSANVFDTRYSEMSFLPGNPNLCGIYINKSCPSSGSTCPADPSAIAGTSFSFFDVVFFNAFGIGFVIGFVSIIAPITLHPILRNRIFVSNPDNFKQIQYGLYREP